MRRIFGLGETVLDILFKENQPVTAKAGGSVLNAMVSLARMGHECYFITELGNDKVGHMITDFLSTNNISTRYIQKYNNGQSALAMAFLNENNDAEYEFYKNYPKDRLTLPLPDFSADDIFLFGSFYAISPLIRQAVYLIAKHAQECGSTVIYDPNIRSKKANSPAQYVQFLLENFQLADMVRGSNEDFDNILDLAAGNKNFDQIKEVCTNLVYTANVQGVFVHTKNFQKHYPVPQINPLSTVGAGDNFNAGIIHGIIQNNLYRKDLQNLNEEVWNSLVDSGIQFSTEVCKSLENYVPINFTPTSTQV